MPLKECLVKTDSVSSLFGEREIPIPFTDELIDTDPKVLAFSPVRGKYSPFLFAGYYYDDTGNGKWFFANGSGPEIHEAIRKVSGYSAQYCTYGQIAFDIKKLINGELVFSSLVLRGGLTDVEKAVDKLKTQIDPRHLDDEFYVNVIR